MTFKKLLITGAASGIGKALAEWADAAGEYALILVDQDETGVFDLIDKLECETMPIPGNVASEDLWQSNILQDSLQDLHAVVFCAAVSDAAAITDMHFERWRRLMSINLDSVFLGMQTCLPKMVDGGAMVVMSSATARKAVANTAAYGASKAAIEQMVRVAALEHVSRGITVNAVAPGGVKTPMFSQQDWFKSLIEERGSEDEAWKSVAALTPTGRFSEAKEVAETIGFLLGPAARNITGSVLSCDGGYTAE